MQSLATKTYIVLLICSLFSSISYAQWQTLGPESAAPAYPTGVSAGKTEYTSIAIAPDRTPYIVFRDYIALPTGAKASVMKYDGSSWQYVGPRGFSAGGVFFTSIAIASDGTPYVIYKDSTQTNKAVVMKFDGTNWSQFGPLVSSVSADFTKIIIDASGVPVVWYKETVTGYCIVKKYDSGTNTWSALTPATGVSGGGVESTSIAINSIGEIYWFGKDGTRQALRKYPGNNTATWTKLGPGGTNNHTGGSNISPVMGIAKNDSIFIFFRDGTSGASGGTVQKYVASGGNSPGFPLFNDVGDRLLSAGGVDHLAITFDNNNTPIIAYRDLSQGNKIIVRRLNKNNKSTKKWDYLKRPGGGNDSILSVGIGAYTALACDKLGVPFLAYTDAGYSIKAAVRRYYIAIPASVTITSTAPNPTNTNPIPVKIDFSEPVTGFDISDVTVTGGTASNFAGSGKNYTVDIIPTTDGSVKVDVAASAATGIDGPTKAATQFSILYDFTKPTVVIASPLTSPTGINPIPVQVDFSESVSGFDASDLVVSNGSVSNFSGSGKTYNFDFIPTADGPITIDIAASVAIDAAANNNTAATQFSTVFNSSIVDTTPPGVTISSSAGPITKIKPIPVSITFSESVLGFTSSDITIAGGTISNFAGSWKNFTMDVTPISDGTITIDIPASSAKDYANNNNTAATQFSIFYCIAPSISAQPANKDICTGLNTSFAVTAAGTNITYQWQVDKGSGFTNVIDNTVYSNATTNTLNITGVTIDMNGYKYQCVVTGACSPSVTSNSASLSLTAIPEIITQPVNKYVCVGSTSFNVSAIGAGLTYQWQVDAGAGFANVSNNTIYGGAATATLAITNPSLSMNGYKYKVIINGTCSPSAISNSVNLNVGEMPPPIVAATPLQCGPGQVALTVSGNTEGNYRWYEAAAGGSPIVNSTSSTFITPVITENRKYYVSVKDGDCESDRVEAPVVITPVPPLPLFGFSYGNRLTSNSSTNNQWLLNSIEIPGAVDKIFYATEPGIYAVRVTVNGCPNTSKARYVEVTESVMGTVTGDDDPIFSNGSVKVYPNPAKEKIHIKYEPTGMPKEVKAYLYSFQGKLLKEKALTNDSNNWETFFELDSYAKGNYFIRISNGKSNISKPFILR